MKPRCRVASSHNNMYMAGCQS